VGDRLDSVERVVSDQYRFVVRVRVQLRLIGSADTESRERR
jgi:hypothetical protein